MKSKDVWLSLLGLTLTILIITILFFSKPNVVTYEALKIETALASSTISATSTDTIKDNEPTLPKVLLDIAWCESRDNQSAIGYNYHTEIIVLEDGSTTTQKVVWSKDIGRFQINDYYHAETARKMGFDIYTVEGNTQYALVLYNNSGTKDWIASQPCWRDIEAWRAKQKSFY